MANTKELKDILDVGNVTITLSLSQEYILQKIFLIVHPQGYEFHF